KICSFDLGKICSFDLGKICPFDLGKICSFDLGKICSFELREYDDSLIPDYLIGDLDSALQENIDYYQSKGTLLILQSSQYYTDFMKSVALINVHMNYPHILTKLSNNIDDLEKQEEEAYNNSKKYSLPIDINIVVVGGIGGRFDQTMSTINQIYNLSVNRPHMHFIIMNPEHTELVFLLPKGTTFVEFPRLSYTEESAIFGLHPSKSRSTLRNVGLLPILTQSILSTHGLKWDVTDWSSSITTKLSSSNLQVGTQGFIVTSDSPLFINIEL
ncbi:hypothetical protein C6P42_004664, partial [Pichia californica]